MTNEFDKIRAAADQAEKEATERSDRRRREVASAIWTASRQDEGTISATGADNIAARLDDAGMLTDSCICDTNPATADGPKEDCPRHGRSYTDWVERSNRLFVHAQAASLALDRIRTRARQVQAKGWVSLDPRIDMQELLDEILKND